MPFMARDDRIIAGATLHSGTPRPARNDGHRQVSWLPDQHLRPAFPVLPKERSSGVWDEAPRSQLRGQRGIFSPLPS